MKAALIVMVAFALMLPGCSAASPSASLCANGHGNACARSPKSIPNRAARVAPSVEELTPVSYDEAPSAAAPPIALTAADGTKLELERLESESVVDGPLAFTELRLSFANPQPRMIEGNFRITLPQGATISRFAMKVHNHWQEGEVVEKQFATKVYEDFLHKKVDPALLEQSAGNEFSARVYPIFGHEKKELILSYSQELSRDAQALVPLVGMPTIGEVDLRVTAATAQTPASAIKQVAYQPKADFRVPEQLWSSDKGLRSGDIVLTRIVPMTTAKPQALGKAMIMIDTSGSQALGLGKQVTLLRALLANMARAGDEAVVVAAFDQDSQLIYQGPASGFGDDHEKRILGRRALGASDLQSALTWAGDVAAKHQLGRVVVVSDGIVTAGDAEGKALRASAKRMRKLGIERFDVIAVGGIRDDEMLRSLVTAGLKSDGVVLKATTPLPIIWRKLNQATRSGIAVAVDGASWWWPKRLDGVQPGDATLVYAKLRPGLAAKIRLDGKLQQSVPLRSTERALLERSYVRAKIASLVEREHKRGRSRSLKQQIVELSKKHRVLSPYTSLLVLEQEWHYKRFGIKRTALADVLTVRGNRLEVLNRSIKLPKRKPSARKPWAATQPGAPTAPWGRDDSLGTDPLSARGNMWGDAIGESFGSGGLGLSGVGEGGGGRAADFGVVGTIGHGAGSASGAAAPAASGTGTGQGFGSGHGRLGRSHRSRPPRIRMGMTQVSGRLPPEVIQRIVRQNFGRFRACYQQGLLRKPELKGRVTVRFVIGRDGAVGTASGAGTLGDDQVIRCVARAFTNLTFPQPEGGIVTVTYPIHFTPSGSSPPPVASSPNRATRQPPPVAAPSPAKPPIAAPYSGELQIIMGALASEQTDEALRQAEAWQAREPGNVLALIALGESLEAKGSLGLAARAYGTIIDLFPSRADMRRYAGARLERINNKAALALAIDSYEKAREQRPDHPSSHRLLAIAQLKQHKYPQAFETLRKGLERNYPSGRFAGAYQIMQEDIGLVAAAWIAHVPNRRAYIQGQLTTLGLKVEKEPSLRFVLNWETDANDVDFHIYDDSGHAFYSSPELPSGGQLYADVTNGYGPECFTIRKPASQRSKSYRLHAQYYSRGPMGYGMGKVQVIDHDGKGGLRFDERPFVVMRDRAYVDLGSVSARVDDRLSYAR